MFLLRSLINLGLILQLLCSTTLLHASTYLGPCCVVLHYSDGTCYPRPGGEYQFTEKDGTYRHKACGDGLRWYNEGEGKNREDGWYYPGVCQGCVYPLPE